VVGPMLAPVRTDTLKRWSSCAARVTAIHAGRVSSAGRSARLSLQATPHPVELAMHGGIVQFMDSSSCQYHDIHRRQAMLLKTDGLSHDALEAVSVDGSADILLAEDQAEAWMISLIGRGEGHQPFAVDLECSRFEDTSIIPGSQQSQLPGIALIDHVRAAVRRSGACGPWHDDVPVQLDHSWWPCAHESHARACA